MGKLLSFPSPVRRHAPEPKHGSSEPASGADVRTAVVVDRQQWQIERANLHLEPFWKETLKQKGLL